jgi:hypothetical protein
LSPSKRRTGRWIDSGPIEHGEKPHSKELCNSYRSNIGHSSARNVSAPRVCTSLADASTGTNVARARGQMFNLWVLAGSALALALAAAYRSRRRKRHEANTPSVPSVSEQWLADRRIYRNDGQ